MLLSTQRKPFLFRESQRDRTSSFFTGEVRRSGCLSSPTLPTCTPALPCSSCLTNRALQVSPYLQPRPRIRRDSLRPSSSSLLFSLSLTTALPTQPLSKVWHQIKLGSFADFWSALEKSEVGAFSAAGER